MKTTKNLATILLIFLVLSLSHLSCGTTEKTAVACPEFSVKKNNKFLSHHKAFGKTRLTTHKANSGYRLSGQLKKNDGVRINKTKNLSENSHQAESITDLNKVNYDKGLIASTDNIIYPGTNNFTLPSLIKMHIAGKPGKPGFPQTTKCDTIHLKSGALLIGKVEEIGQTEIKYRKCNNLTGPIISISKTDVKSIQYSNGTNDLISETNTFSANQTNQLYNNYPVLKTEGLGLAGFISGLAGLFIASIPLGLIAVIFGSISLSRIKKQPGRYKGRGFAIASLILGLIDVVAMIILLGTL
jgi:hypothetical protein